MSKQVLISLLKQGNTGNEILGILDAISAGETDTNSVSQSDPTLEEIEF
jgi:hypothetical protein